MLSYRGYNSLRDPRMLGRDNREWVDVLFLVPDGLARSGYEYDMSVPVQDATPTLWVYAIKGRKVRVWRCGAMEPMHNCHLVDRGVTLKDVPPQYQRRVESLLRSL